MSKDEGCRHFLTINCASAVIETLKAGEEVENLPPSYSFVRNINFEPDAKECHMTLCSTEPSTDIAGMSLNLWADYLRAQYHAHPDNEGILFWCLLSPADEDTTAQSFICVFVKLAGYEPVLYRFTPNLELLERSEVGDFLPMFEVDFEEEIQLQ